MPEARLMIAQMALELIATGRTGHAQELAALVLRAINPPQSSDGGTFTEPNQIWKSCAVHENSRFVYASRCPLCIALEFKP